MNNTALGHPATAASTLEPYAQLLRALLPRMDSMSVFNARGELYWSSEMAVGPEMSALVPSSLSAAENEPAANGEQRNTRGEPVYLFWLRRDDGALPARPFAVVALNFRAGNADVEQRSFSFVQALVKPAIECLRRELMARNEILNLQSSMLEQDNDLEMLLSVSGGGPESVAEGGNDLKAIVASATEHLKVGLSALIVPEKGIALVQASAESPLATSLLAKAHRHLLSMAQVRRQATIVNRMVLQQGTSSATYRVLACPIARPDGRSMGVLALFRAEDCARIHAASRASDRTAGPTRGHDRDQQLRRADRPADTPGIRTARARGTRGRQGQADQEREARLECVVHRHQPAACHQ
jgi:hypothetical protein